MKSTKQQSLFAWIIPALVLFTFSLVSCDKSDNATEKNNKPSGYSSEVLQKWMNLQLRLMKNATGIPNHGFGRHFAYTGVAVIESLEPGAHGHATLTGKWNGLTGLPEATHRKEYFYPANVNAAAATINRLMFPAASAADKAAIDSLELALKQEFLATQPAAVISFSENFGKQVATAVYNWAEADGYKSANAPYTLPVGPGLWKPTAPALAPAATPYWGNNRTVVTGSIENTKPAAPVAYSEEPESAFYLMVKEAYEASKAITEDQKAMANFWKDVPGATTPGHWLSVLLQLVQQRNSNLENAAVAYALVGAAVNDASIAVMKWKYFYNLVRPVTYVREVFGHSTWLPFLGTPAHPEYVSAHSTISMAAARVLDNLFPPKNSFTDHTYDYLGYTPRTYPNTIAMAVEAGQSRLYAGIHYNASIQAGFAQGNRVGTNILAR